MSISSFFSKMKYGSYKESKRASVYEEIAKRCNASPQHVYEIAHGKSAKSPNDNYIYQVLKEKGIISRRHK